MKSILLGIVSLAILLHSKSFAMVRSNQVISVPIDQGENEVSLNITWNQESQLFSSTKIGSIRSIVNSPKSLDQNVRKAATFFVPRFIAFFGNFVVRKIRENRNTNISFEEAKKIALLIGEFLLPVTRSGFNIAILSRLDSDSGISFSFRQIGANPANVIWSKSFFEKQYEHFAEHRLLATTALKQILSLIEVTEVDSLNSFINLESQFFSLARVSEVPIFLVNPFYAVSQGRLGLARRYTERLFKKKGASNY